MLGSCSFFLLVPTFLDIDRPCLVYFKSFRFHATYFLFSFSFFLFSFLLSPVSGLYTPFWIIERYREGQKHISAFESGVLDCPGIYKSILLQTTTYPTQ